MSHITVETRTFQCACSRVFEAEILMHIDLEVFIVHLKKIRCPSCCADLKIYFHDPAASA